MDKTIMLYTDPCNGTSGYARVAREIGKRLAQRGWGVYYQEHSSKTPAHSQDGMVIMPSMVERSPENMPIVITSTIRLINPSVFMPISDPFLMVEDGLHKLHYSTVKFMPYVLIDSTNVHDDSDVVFNKANKIFVASDFGKQQIKHYGYNSEVLYHGVDFDQFFPAKNDEEKMEKRVENGIPTDKFVFLSIGRNGNRKRYVRLLESIAMFNRDRPENNAHFLLHIADHDRYGFNLETLRQRLAGRYNVKMNNVEFTMQHTLSQGIGDDVIADYYKAADAYVTASSGEGFGLPIVEAMASKIPVIAPRNTTHETFLREGRGILCKNEGMQFTGYGTKQPLVDIDDLSLKMQNLYDSSIETKQMITKAYTFVRRYCNWDKIVEQLDNSIQKTIRGEK